MPTYGINPLDEIWDEFMDEILESIQSGEKTVREAVLGQMDDLYSCTECEWEGPAFELEDDGKCPKCGAEVEML